ncbi:hypothetical protein KP509_18G060200 [Ceratopteris richardii]|nr:hypothetical protein KP509_18G060200 [Ceratopteris richardii]
MQELRGIEEDLQSLQENSLSQSSVGNLALIVKKYRKGKELHFGFLLHGYICKVGLEGHSLLGNLLVQMMIDMGSMLDARKTFDMMVTPNEWSWTSLINGYVKCGKPENAFLLYNEMLSSAFVYPTGHTYLALLKACYMLKDLEKGLGLHTDIARMGLLEKDSFVGSALVDMYIKFGLIAKAQEVFDNLSSKDVVSWTALIAGYSESGYGEEALKLLEDMQLGGIAPDAVTYVCGLKASTVMDSVIKGLELHGEIERRGLMHKDLPIGNTLVDMYAKFGMLSQAQEVFDRLPLHDVVSWTALIAGYTEHSQEEEALECFRKMQQMGFFVNAVTFACVLRACGNSKCIEQGEEIHSMIRKRDPQLENDVYVGCALVDMYSKFGFISKAQQVFEKLASRTVFTWNMLITGYVEHGQCEDALICLELMKLESVSPDNVTHITGLKACGILGTISKGVQIHAEIEINRLPQSDAVVGSVVLDMYTRFGLLEKAHQVFQKLPVREAPSWTSLISGHIELEQADLAIDCFEYMQHEGVAPDSMAVICSLKACAILGAVDKLQLIHAEVERIGIFEHDHAVRNNLISFYAKLDRLDIAKEVFENLSSQDATSWTSLVAAYADQGQDEAALDCFYRMQMLGFSAPGASYVIILKACGSIGDIAKGYKFHTEIELRGLFESELAIGNGLVSMYANFGMLQLARQVFNRVAVKNEVSWAALIAGYVQSEEYEEVLKCYESMLSMGIFPDSIIFYGCLKACICSGAMDKGVGIHTEIERLGFIERDPMVATTVIYMYAKCGYLPRALEMFDRLTVQDVASWTALMGGYVQSGQGADVLAFFGKMLDKGLQPDAVTFVILLNACSKAGLYEKSEVLFEAMSKDYGIAPVHEHYNYIVNVLVCKGHISEATTLMKKMPTGRHSETWQILLATCRSMENFNLGKEAFDQVLGLDKTSTIAYVYLSHLLAAAKDGDTARCL